VRALSRSLRRPTVLQLALLLAVAGAAASAAPVGASIASIHRAGASVGLGRLAGIGFSYPELNGAAWVLLGLALIGSSAIAIALRAALRQRRAYRRFLAEIEVVGRLGDGAGVQVIADPRPQAFCAGYLRPTVYISQGALELLSDDELEAVLAHEHHHRRVRDPLRFACGRTLSHALFFVPALRTLFGRYADLAELNADGAAVRAGAGGRAALASALLAFEGSGVGISPERVDSLLGNPVVWRRPWWLLTASVGSLSSLITLTWSASRAASARATFNLPFVSSHPCLLMLTVVPLLGVITTLGRRSRTMHAGDERIDREPGY
jgi:Zn-dependent protease with chaperone function